MKIIIMAFLSLILISCGLTRIPEVTNYSLLENFLKFGRTATTSEMNEKFMTFSLEDQYEIYIYCNQIVHPPRQELAILLSEKGQTIIPFLSEKLKDTNNELTIRDIIMIFEWISVKKLYDFPKDQKLMNLIEHRVNNMKSIWKSVVLDEVEVVRTGKFKFY